MATSSLQWVQPPEGAWIYIERGIQQGLKLSPGILPFDWKGRSQPEPYLQVFLKGPLPSRSFLYDHIGRARVSMSYDNREYAYVYTLSGAVFPCKAQGLGGDLTVTCNNLAAGTLLVRENAWDGWYAWLDGSPVSRISSPWLSVSVPAGQHEIHLRYLPVDVWVGLLLGMAGAAACLRLWRANSEVKFRVGDDRLAEDIEKND